MTLVVWVDFSSPKIQLTGPHGLTLTEQTWADLTRLQSSFVWQNWMTLRLRDCRNPKTIKACLSKTSLSFIPHLSSDPLFCCLDSSRVYPRLCSAYVFLIYPLPPFAPPFSPVLGPLCHGNPLFPLCPITHAHAHEHRWSESVYFSGLNIYLTMTVFCWSAVWQIRSVSRDKNPNILADSLRLIKK